MAVQVTQPDPQQVGPVRIEPFAGSTVAVTCPRSDVDPVMRRAGGHQWQRATRVWLLERRRARASMDYACASGDDRSRCLRRAGLKASTRELARRNPAGVRLAKLVEQLATDAARWAEGRIQRGRPGPAVPVVDATGQRVVAG